MAGLAAGLRPQAVFALGETAELEARLAESGHPLADAPVYAVDRRVAARLSTLESPAPLMAVFPLPASPPLGELALDWAPAGERPRPLAVYADRLADPGNLGTLVREAAAFAAAALVASPGSVDLYAPKVVRAGMGAVFALPLYQEMALARVVEELQAAPVYGLVAHGGKPLDEVVCPVPPGGPALLVVGAERAGLSADALACVTDLVTIPLAGATGGGVESLNAGVAGAIALYQLSRPGALGARKE